MGCLALIFGAVWLHHEDLTTIVASFPAVSLTPFKSASFILYIHLCYYYGLCSASLFHTDSHVVFKSTYGRNRQSRTDIEEELTDIFKSLSEGSLNDAGEPVLPAKGLVDVLRIYGERHGGVRLLEENAEDKLREIVQNMPGIELTPQVVVSLVVNLTEHTPGNSPSHDSEHSDDNGVDDESGSNHSHSSHSSGHDRPSALPPKTPVSAHFSNSPFDSGRRQRTIPLQHAAPSSWNARKPQPSSRRRSDAGSYGRPTSDTEVSAVVYCRKQLLRTLLSLLVHLTRSDLALVHVHHRTLPLRTVPIPNFGRVHPLPVLLDLHL